MLLLVGTVALRYKNSRYFQKVKLVRWDGCFAAPKTRQQWPKEWKRLAAANRKRYTERNRVVFTSTNARPVRCGAVLRGCSRFYGDGLYRWIVNYMHLLFYVIALQSTACDTGITNSDHVRFRRRLVLHFFGSFRAEAETSWCRSWQEIPIDTSENVWVDNLLQSHWW